MACVHRDGMHRSPGSSLIESLVALAIFAIGSAATGAWLARSVAIDVEATRSAIATTLGLSLEARMRANERGLDDGHYAYPASLATNCAEACDAAALAAADMAWFRRAVTERLAANTQTVVRCNAGECVIRVDDGGRTVLDWTFLR